jgi:hypothetical protein
MVATNLALGLTLASVLIASVAFVGAHNTVLRVPDFSRLGCLSAVVLVLIATAVAAYPPIDRLGTCTETCGEVIDNPPADFDKLPFDHAAGVSAMNVCTRGADSTYKKALEEAAAGGPPAVREDPAEVKTRCRAWAMEQCSRACFEGEPEPIKK